MVLIVHGFPNMISALRFEWAWTKPKQSRRLRHLPAKRTKETMFTYCFRVMCEMLRTGPWNRLPLTLRWLKHEYHLEFDPTALPPPHIPIEYGPVKSTKVKQPKQKEDVADQFKSSRCTVCKSSIKTQSDEVSCLGCSSTSHIICLARLFLQQYRQNDMLMPIEGDCPSCQMTFLWGDIIRFKHGCYRGQLTSLCSQQNSQGVS